MAIGFGSTDGTGTTNIIRTGLIGQNAQRSYAVSVYRRGVGGSGAGRILDVQGNGTTIEYLAVVDNARIIYGRRFSNGVDYRWQLDGTAVAAQYAIALSYDSSSTATNPTIFVNGAAATLIAPSARSGTVQTSATDEYTIGNRADLARVWDGHISHFAIWNQLIPDDIAKAISGGMSPLIWRHGLIYYAPMIRTVQDLVGARSQTVSGTAVQPHPRAIGI